MQGTIKSFFYQKCTNCAVFHCETLYNIAQYCDTEILKTDNFDDLAKAHIYLIGQHSRVKLLSISEKTTNGFLISYMIYTKEKPLGIVRESKWTKDFLYIDSIEIIDDGYACIIHSHEMTGEKCETKIPAWIILSRNFCNVSKELIDIKVLYIGQSLGHQKEVRRSAIDRLLKHEKLQRILIDFEDKTWAKICIFLFEFSDKGGSLDILQHDRKSSFNKSIKKWLTRFLHPIDNGDNIDLIEASLIRYFKPQYNIQLNKQNPPRKKFTFFAKLSHDDYKGIVIEINTQVCNFKLYSEAVPQPSFHHCIPLLPDNNNVIEPSVFFRHLFS